MRTVAAAALGLAFWHAALLGSPCAAQAGNIRQSPVLSEVTRCRTIPADDVRLACFDRSVKQLDEAKQHQDLVVIDRQQVRDTRKTLFGINLPDIGILGRSSDDVDHVDAVIAAAQADGNGRWVLRMQDGATWVQTDDYIIARRPRPNDKVIIRRAALGSFRLSVGEQPAVKVRRIN